MNQRERLIELLYCVGLEYNDYTDDCHENGMSPMESFDEFAADYLLQHGVFVPPAGLDTASSGRAIARIQSCSTTIPE